jgi:hypothetical protein
LTPHNTINIRAFGTKISANRVRNGELSLEQRNFCLAQAEASVNTREIAGALSCTRRCVQKTI